MKSPIPQHHTMKPTYLMATLLTAFGGFLSLNKSVWTPTTRIEFLGLLLDSLEETVEVPLGKYEKCMALINEFLKGDNGKFCIKKLESIRGKITSWLLVAPNLGLYQREMNEVRFLIDNNELPYF